MVNQRRYQVLWAFIGVGVFIIMAGLVLAFLYRSPAAPPVPPAPTPATVQEVPRVTLSDAKAALEAGTAVFVDVRDSSSYNRSHIPGAVNIPVSDLTNHLSELNRSDWIITYCT
jgi:3-mercaptopyruvate sulfurtransferase SseA